MDAASTGCGPISMNVSMPSSAMAAMAGAKRTAWRTLRPKYPASGTPSSAVPVTVENTGTAGVARRRPASSASRRCWNGAICALWKAYGTGSRRWLTPRALKASSTWFSAASSPESTTLRGPFKAASESRSPSGRSSSVASSSLRPTAAMRPRPVACCIRWPRCQTTRMASGRFSAPATCKAATSPTLWPITALGSTPQDFQSAASATCSANSAGCATSVSLRRETTSSAPSCSSSDQPDSGRSSASHCSITSRNTGSSASSSRPMANHCGPCPLNTKPRRGSAVAERWPLATAGESWPCRKSFRRARSSSALRPTTARRTSWCVRRSAAVKITSLKGSRA